MKRRGVTLERRVRELRKVYIAAMRASSSAHRRGAKADSTAHYARAQRALSEMNALGHGLFGPMR